MFLAPPFVALLFLPSLLHGDEEETLRARGTEAGREGEQVSERGTEEVE